MGLPLQSGGVALILQEKRNRSAQSSIAVEESEISNHKFQILHRKGVALYLRKTRITLLTRAPLSAVEIPRVPL